jgi:hypothetical protein
MCRSCRWGSVLDFPGERGTIREGFVSQSHSSFAVQSSRVKTNSSASGSLPGRPTTRGTRKYAGGIPARCGPDEMKSRQAHSLELTVGRLLNHDGIARSPSTLVLAKTIVIDTTQSANNVLSEYLILCVC